MSLLTQKEGITLIGAPWSWKTTIWGLLDPYLEWWEFHDMDDDGLQNPQVWWGSDWVANKLHELWDNGFLEAEWRFVLDNYGRKAEWKYFSFEKTLFSSTWSLPLSPEAMKHVRERTHVILIDVPISILVERSNKWRPDGNSRIVGMNGKTPQFKTLEETLEYRWEIYRKSADIIVPYKRDEAVTQNAGRVLDLLNDYKIY
jgi:Shikimate kinase